MPNDYRVGVDWDNDGFIAFDAVPSDEVNLIQEPINLSANTISVTGTGASQSEESISQPFGIEVIDWQSGTSSNGALLIGSNADPIAPVNALSVYTLSFWIDSENASYDAVPLRLRIQDTSSVTIFTSANFTITNAAGWVQKLFTFIPPSGVTGIKIILDKNTSTTNASYDISGLMLTQYQGDNLVRWPLEISNYTTSLTGTATAVTIQSITEDFGDYAFDFVTGTDVNSTLRIGAVGNGIAYVTPSTAYTAVFWIRSESASYDAVNMLFRIRRATGSEADLTVTSAAPIPFASGWVKQVINFTTDGSTSEVMLLVSKSGSATNASYDVAGLTILLGTYSSGDAPDFDIPTVPAFNTGLVSQYENITAWVKQMRWNIGATEAYAALANENVCELTLNNLDKIFSPENPNSPITGSRSNRRVKIDAYGPSSSDWQTQYQGWLESLNPVPGANGPYEATLVATSARRFFEGQQVRVALMVGVGVQTAVQNIAAEVDFPPGIFSITAVDYRADQWAYVGDNWEEGIDALSAIVECIVSERGFGYWNRLSTLTVKTRAWRYDTDDTESLEATFDNIQEAMDYRYGDVVYNVIEVVYYPRKASSSTTLQLWELNEDFTLAIAEQYTIFARFTNGDENKTIGAASVAEGTFTASGAGVTRTYTAKSNGVEILYNNTSGASRTVTAHTIQGQRITSKDAITIRVEDATSIAANGRLSLRLDCKLVSAKADAQQIAAYELARHKDPRGRVASITIGPRNDTQLQYMVDLTVQDKIRVIEDQVEHTGDYVIVGMEHEVTDALTVHRVTYHLEPAVDLI